MHLKKKKKRASKIMRKIGNKKESSGKVLSPRVHSFSSLKITSRP